MKHQHTEVPVSEEKDNTPRVKDLPPNKTDAGQRPPSPPVSPAELKKRLIEKIQNDKSKENK